MWVNRFDYEQLQKEVFFNKQLREQYIASDKEELHKMINQCCNQEKEIEKLKSEIEQLNKENFELLKEVKVLEAVLHSKTYMKESEKWK